MAVYNKKGQRIAIKQIARPTDETEFEREVVISKRRGIKAKVVKIITDIDWAFANWAGCDFVTPETHELAYITSENWDGPRYDIPIVVPIEKCFS